MRRITILCCICVLNTTWINAQHNIENIVFEGAGIRGIAYAGVIKALEETEHLAQIIRVGGTSAGAITALALSVGYNANELETLVSSTNFNHFNDGQAFFVGGSYRLSKKYGWYRGQRFLSWIEQVQFTKTGIHHITFRQLKELGFKDLYITGTSLNRQKLIVFSAETYPNMRVSDAVRISMSIPLYFQAVPIDSQGKVVSQKVATDIMVDGGVLSNFPITLFDSIHVEGDKIVRIPNLKTVGIRIDSDEQIKEDEQTHELADYAISSLPDYLGAFYTILLESLNRAALNQSDWDRTVSVSSKNISPRLRKLSLEQKNSLMTSGQMSMISFLKK